MFIIRKSEINGLKQLMKNYTYCEYGKWQFKRSATHSSMCQDERKGKDAGQMHIILNIKCNAEEVVIHTSLSALIKYFLLVRPLKANPHEKNKI